MAAAVPPTIPSVDPNCTALLLYAEDPADMPHTKLIELRPMCRLSIGRVTGPKNSASRSNCFFDARVLSRKHAELWTNHDNRVFICDIGSSNGTFINGQRLSPDNTRSDDRQIYTNDKIEFGVNIFDNNEDEIVHRKVTLRVRILPAKSDAATRKQFLSIAEDYFCASYKLSSPKMSRSSSNSMAISNKSLVEQVQMQLAKNKQFSEEFKKLQHEAVSVRGNPDALHKIRRNVAELEREQVAARQQIDSLLNAAATSRSSDEKALVSQLESLSTDNKLLIAEVCVLEKRLQATDAAASRAWNQHKVNESSSSSCWFFMVVVSILVAIVAAAYYVLTNPAAEKYLVDNMVENFNFDPTIYLDQVKRVSADAFKEANSIFEQIKNTLFPHVEA